MLWPCAPCWPRSSARLAARRRDTASAPSPWPGHSRCFAAVIRSRRESRLIRISERVQHAILRPLPAELGGVAFASHYQSATTAALVGGDLYDITMTQFGPRFIIGDVKGKGLDAVGRCAAVLAIFRELAFGEADLVGLAEKMDARLSRDMEIEDFVTVILAEFAPGEVRMVNCGHHPPAKLIGRRRRPADHDPGGVLAATRPASAPGPAGHRAEARRPAAVLHRRAGRDPGPRRPLL